MPSIFLFEECTAAAEFSRLGSVLNSQLRTEGQAMLLAVAEDFTALPGWQVAVGWSGPPAQQLNKSLQIIPCGAAARQILTRAAKSFDWILVIAPECDGILHERCATVELAGGKLLGPSADFVALAGNKQLCIEHLAAAGVPVPHGGACSGGAAAPQEMLRRLPVVIKPCDGAGAQGLQVIRDVVALPQNARGVPCLPQAFHAWRWETFLQGQGASQAFLCGPRGSVPLAPCSQHIVEITGGLEYRGGTCPLPTGLAERVHQLASRALAALPPARGYVGIDVQLGPDTSGEQDYVLEVNPRLTTSYLGLRAVAQANLAAAMAQTASGSPTVVDFDTGQVEFDCAGTIRGL
jgi:hypothetical protein